MKPSKFPPRRRASRLLQHSLTAGAAIAAPQAVDAAVAPPDDIDIDNELATDEQLQAVLADANGFDATCAAAGLALHPDVRLRRALAEALATPFHLVGDDFVLDQLAIDDDAGVRAAATRALHARGLAATPSSRAPRVLVIDDYSAGRAALCACLAEVGCDAIGASSAIAKSDVPWPEHFDLVVANDDPPWMDGPELIARLRRHAPDLPAIVMGNPTDTSLVSRATMADEITLMKPITLADLQRAIDALVSRRP